MTEILGFGALNYDRLYKVKGLAEAGKETSIADAKEEMGGSAANTITGLARLGFDTGYIGIVGNDTEGNQILENLKREGVNTDLVIQREGKTGTAIIFIDPAGERTMYLFPGVTTTLSLEDIDLRKVKEAKFLHMSSFQGKKQLEMQKEFVSKLKTVKLSYAPGTSIAKKGAKTLKQILKRAYVLFLNTNEVKLLTGLDYEQGSKKLIELGVKNVAVTLGKEGCFVTNGKVAEKIPAKETKVVDTTGAGDAFNAGFLAAFLKGKGLKEAGHIGNKVASKCIEKLGARVGLPRKSDLGGIL